MIGDVSPLSKLSNGKARKGKWSKEEEAYTSTMITAFQIGLLPKAWKVLQGTTLRVFLANRLCCDAMRITKKFAGAEAIGKQVYKPTLVTKDNQNALLSMEASIARSERLFITKLKSIMERRAARKQRAPSPKTGPKTKGLKRKQIDVSSPISVNKVVVVQQNVQSKKNKRAFKKLASERDATALLLNFFTSVHAAQKLV